MDTFKSFETILYQLNGAPFDDIALELFRFQARNNAVYRRYIDNLAIKIDDVDRIEKIPFLPISLFKTQAVKTGDWPAQQVFESSGTTQGNNLSRHEVYNLQHYLKNARRCFEFSFGDLKDYHILALLPSYLERQNSSLVTMIRDFIIQSDSTGSGFYLHELDKLQQDIERLKPKGKKILLWGVSFALLDFVEKYHPDLEGCLVMETGGMKGRRRELTREELHHALIQGLRVDKIYSEYGMTELLSQAYTRGGSRFHCPPTMKVMAREIGDPFQVGICGQTGGINVIDLANIHSLAFVETEDVGKVFGDGTFEIMGRLDHSDVRGCNLLVE